LNSNRILPFTTKIKVTTMIIKKATLRSVATGLVLATGLTGCDSLLDVELPTRVPASTLDDPALAAVLVQGAVSDFECALTNFIPAVGLLTDELIDSTGWIAVTTWDQRRVLPDNGNLGTADCNTLGYGIYTPLQTARFQAEDAFKRIEAFPDAEVPTKKSLMATAAAYAGYVYVIMGEAFCEIAVDGGPGLQPAQVLAKAEERFTTAIDLAQASNSTQILNMARVGRARARLDLGKKTEAAADAQLVPQGFVMNASRSAVNARRWNRIAVDFHRNFFLSVDPTFRGLSVDGKADPRVPAADAGRRGHDGTTQVFNQTKYRNDGDPIAIATWHEAQLILAEALGGTPAVEAINRVRTAWSLPAFSSSDAEEIRRQVLEERRRELYLEGHRLGDMLRHNIPLPAGSTHKGVPRGETKCLPLPDVERLNNPNFKS
jgi:hypothetical protein